MIAAWSLQLLVRLSPSDLRGLDEVAIDGTVLAFTAAVGLLRRSQ